MTSRPTLSLTHRDTQALLDLVRARGIQHQVH
jgi:hypothetical protein